MMTVSPIMNFAPFLRSTVRAMGLFLFTALRSFQSIRQESTWEDVKWGLRRQWSRPTTARTGKAITITVTAEDSEKRGGRCVYESCRYAARSDQNRRGSPRRFRIRLCRLRLEQFQDRLLRLRSEGQRGDAQRLTGLQGQQRGAFRVLIGVDQGFGACLQRVDQAGREGLAALNDRQVVGQRAAEVLDRRQGRDRLLDRGVDGSRTLEAGRFPAKPRRAEVDAVRGQRRAPVFVEVSRQVVALQQVDAAITRIRDQRVDLVKGGIILGLKVSQRTGGGAEVDIFRGLQVAGSRRQELCAETKAGANDQGGALTGGTPECKLHIRSPSRQRGEREFPRGGIEAGGNQAVDGRIVVDGIDEDVNGRVCGVVCKGALRGMQQVGGSFAAHGESKGIGAVVDERRCRAGRVCLEVSKRRASVSNGRYNAGRGIEYA